MAHPRNNPVWAKLVTPTISSMAHIAGMPAIQFHSIVTDFAYYLWKRCPIIARQLQDAEDCGHIREVLWGNQCMEQLLIRYLSKVNIQLAVTVYEQFQDDSDAMMEEDYIAYCIMLEMANRINN